MCGRVVEDVRTEVKMKVLVVQKNESVGHPIPTLEGAGWFIGVKIIRCNDQYGLD